MAQPISLEGSAEVQTLLSRLPDALFQASKDVFRASVLNVHDTISNRIRDGSGNTLHSRTGALKRSMQFRVAGASLSTIKGSVFSVGGITVGGDVIPVKYALIHEKGGTINAIDKYMGVPGGPYLNVPLPANQTPVGATQQSARMVFAGGGYIIKSKKGNWIVMSGKGEPMFYLRKSSTIPARLGMVKAGEDEIPTLLSKLNESTENALQDANR